MTYPPGWRQVSQPDFATQLMREYPFAHLLSRSDSLHATRIPVMSDFDGDGRLRLRAHLNAQNPQAADLEGSEVLVVFSGPATYVSPHWRIDKTRAGTYDYEEVQVRGRVRVHRDLAFFRDLVDGLSALIEPRYAEVSGEPVWTTAMAPDGYLERLFPQVVCFSIDPESVRSISKLHQHFPEADRRSIAAHLERCHQQEARTIAGRILQSLAGDTASGNSSKAIGEGR
jgi:transcriptional regulator